MTGAVCEVCRTALAQHLCFLCGCFVIGDYPSPSIVKCITKSDIQLRYVCFLLKEQVDFFRGIVKFCFKMFEQ